MNTPDHRSNDVSWPLLATITAVIISALYFLSYNVLYTEGEVMQALFIALMCVTAGLALIGFYSRRTAAWCIVIVGGCLLLRQAFQLRKWAILHEDIVGLVRFAEDVKSKTGRYPSTFDGYAFKNGWVKSHIQEFGLNDGNEFGITYFINHRGISYWYSSKTGFGYYPD